MFRPSPPSIQPGHLHIVLPSDTVTRFVFGNMFYDYYGFIWKPPAHNGHISAPLRKRYRSYNAPAQAAPHRVRSLTFIAHPSPLLCRVTERILDFGSWWYLVLPTKPARDSHQVWVTTLTTASFRFLIGSDIPFIPRRVICGSFFGHPCLHLHVASFQGSWLDLHQLVNDHAGRTSSKMSCWYK